MKPICAIYLKVSVLLLFLVFNKVISSAQVDFGIRNSLTVSITDFGANPDDNLDDTWAFIKLSKWLNNVWDKNGIPYSSPACTPSHQINYLADYIVVDFPASTNGGAYLVGKEVDPATVNPSHNYSHLHEPAFSTENIPYADIFGTAVVPTANTQGVVIPNIIKYDTPIPYPLPSYPNLTTSTLNYSTLPWVSTTIIALDVTLTPASMPLIDGIWFRGHANTVIKKNPGMHLGFWDENGDEYPGSYVASPLTDWYHLETAPINHWASGGVDSRFYSGAYWALQQNGGNHLFAFKGAKNIKFTDIEIDGNKQTIQMGGKHPRESIQSGSIGLYFEDTKQISIENMHIHHTSFDGIYVKDNDDLTLETKVECKNTRLNYNGRMAFAWISGKKFTFDHVDFNYAGKLDDYTPAGYGNPNCGMDIEPDVTATDFCSDGLFTNCTFIGNLGVAITCNTNSENVTDMVFDHCTMWDGDSYGLICKGKNLHYTHCSIYCPILYFGVHDGFPTIFDHCRFEDKPNPFNPLQVWNAYDFQDGNERPCNYLMQTTDNSLSPGQSKGTLFNTCHFKLNDVSREMFKIFTKGVGSTPSTPSDEYTTFADCDFTYANDGVTFNDGVTLFFNPSYLSGAVFRGNTLIQNTNNVSSSKHEWCMSAIEIEGSTNPCLANKFEVSGNIILTQKGLAPNILLFGRNGSSSNSTGYLNSFFKNNACLHPIVDYSFPIAPNITAGENSLLRFEQTASLLTTGPLLATSGFEFYLSGQLILAENSFYHFKNYKFHRDPFKTLFYIDKQAIDAQYPNGNIWYPSGISDDALHGYTLSASSVFPFPCIHGDKPNLGSNAIPCSPNYSSISNGNNTSITILFNKLDNNCSGGSSGEIEYKVIGAAMPYDVYLNGVNNNFNPITNLMSGNYQLSVLDANGCSNTLNITITEPAPVTVNATFTNVSCNGAADGTITATGSPGSTITINGAPPAANYGPGVYTVVATAPGGNTGQTCTATTTVTISEPTVVSVNATFTNVTCNGAADGTITATGSPGSTITINGAPLAANYGPGVYTVVATAPGGNAGQTCTATTTVTIGTDWVNYCCNSAYASASAPKEHLEGIPYDYAISTHVPAFTTYSGYTFFVHNNLVIDQSTTFDNCTFLFTVNSKITVAAGQTLTLNTCTLKAGCNAMWDGIYASGAGSEVVINGGVLQDMENGVVISMQGKLTSDGPTYRDNYQSIQLLGLPSGYNGSIVHSVFEGLNGLITPYNASDRPKHGIVVNGCYHIVIGDESDVTKGNLFEGLQNGIYIEYDASFISAFQQTFVGIYYNRFEGIDQGVGFDSPETIGGASMYEDPEGSAIFGYNKLVKHKITAEIIGNDANSSMYNFDGCTKDIVLNAFNATVLKNFSKHSPGGFLFSQCEGKNIRVSDNVLEDVRLGIANTGNAQAFHCDNNIITVSDDNFSYGIMSTQYSKNTGATLLHYNNITLPNFDYSQGVNIAGGTNDNLIGNLIHFTNNSTQAALTAVPTLAGIKVVNSTNTVFENNTIEGLNSNNFLSNRRVTGFYLHKCTQATIDCNIARDMQFGIYVVGDNKTGAYDRVKNNLFSSSKANLLFRHLSNEGSLGDIGLNQQIPLYVYDANNKFFTPTIDPIYLAHLYRLSLATSVANGDKLVTASSTLDQSSPLASSSYPSGHQYTIDNPSNFDETFNCNPPNAVSCIFATPNTDLPDMRDAIAIASQAQQYLEYPDGGRWLDERFLYEWLKLDTSLAVQFPILDSFYEACNGDILGSLWEIDNMISLLTDSTQLEAEQDWHDLHVATRAANEAIDEGLIFAQKAKWINGLFLDYLEYGMEVIDSSLRSEIYTLAIQCPYLMGEAVFKARDMVAMFLAGLDYDDMEICHGQGVYKGGMSWYTHENALLNQTTSGTKELFDYLSVYPNPFRDELSITHLFPTQLKATFKLFDLTGKLCIVRQFDRDAASIHLSLDILPPGMYLYEYTIENGVCYHGKLFAE